MVLKQFRTLPFFSSKFQINYNITRGLVPKFVCPGEGVPQPDCKKLQARLRDSGSTQLELDREAGGWPGKEGTSAYQAHLTQS